MRRGCWSGFSRSSRMTSHDAARPHERVPAVEAEEAAEVDAEARERERPEDAEPRDRRPDRALPDHLHEVSDANPSTSAVHANEASISASYQSGDRRRVVEVDEVREHVRRVREEEQPEHPEQRPRPDRSACARAGTRRARTRTGSRRGRGSTRGSGSTCRPCGGPGTRPSRRRAPTRRAAPGSPVRGGRALDSVVGSGVRRPRRLGAASA